MAPAILAAEGGQGEVPADHPAPDPDESFCSIEGLVSTTPPMREGAGATRRFGIDFSCTSKLCHARGPHGARLTKAAMVVARPSR
jgi:hypothetical protein